MSLRVHLGNRQLEISIIKYMKVGRYECFTSEYLAPIRHFETLTQFKSRSRNNFTRNGHRLLSSHISDCEKVLTIIARSDLGCI